MAAGFDSQPRSRNAEFGPMLPPVCLVRRVSDRVFGGSRHIATLLDAVFEIIALAFRISRFHARQRIGMGIIAKYGTSGEISRNGRR